MRESGPDAVSLKLHARALEPRLPSLFAPASRSADGTVDPFLPPGYLRAKSTFEVGVSTRDGGSGEQTRAASPEEVVVLELADGGVLVTSAGRLRETLERARPELIGKDGELLLDHLRSGPDTRGLRDTLGSLVKRLFTFAAGEVRDTIFDKAIEKATDPLVIGVSWAGTRALMWAIEERLDQPAGELRRWSGGSEFSPKVTSPQGPMLVFVHGTASNTRGSFGDIREGDPALWRELERRYTGGIHGFEHRTLSESPIENALQLVKELPQGAKVSLVSHSRGGLVADLLCLDAEAAALPEAIEQYRYPTPHTGDADPAESQRVRRELDGAHAEHRALLHELARLLGEREITIERYVRVASPARGTKLASGNFDVFLSGLLTLIGQVPFLRTSVLYAAFKRVAIEIAKHRTNPHLVPGIEAMLPDSPMARLLRVAPVKGQIEMAVIAGDIEGGGMLQRLGTLLTDTLLFDRTDNDLVVDSAAMLGGVAQRSAARVLFDRGAEVSHFRYFANRRTRGALGDWLVAGPRSRDSAFTALPSTDDAPFQPDPVRRDGAADTRPIVVVLPGLMGTQLETGGGDLIWLDPLNGDKAGLRAMAWDAPGVRAGDLFSLFYGGLCERLQTTHRVERFPYDWRQPLDVLADRLAALLKRLLDDSEGRPVRLLAHGMGGLVVRAAIHTHRPLLDRLMARDGARLVMCGTPHQGTHAMVENLIGKGDTLRTLVRLDLASDMQEMLDIVSGFRGALALLPKPGFVDTFQGQPGGGEAYDYQAASTWVEIRQHVTDHWFGDGRAAKPAQDVLDASRWLWRRDGPEKPKLPASYASKSVYVAGEARNTPCGLVRDARGRLRMVGTARGDGIVTWDSGRIDGQGSFYYMPAAHGDLLSTTEHFDALVELLAEGRTRRLSMTPPTLRTLAADAAVQYDAGPPTVEDADVVVRMALGGAMGVRVPPRARQTLRVAVKAMDLRFVRSPIMVGHYQDDPIAGPEAIIDRELLDGELRERYDLSQYAGPRGTATAVLMRTDPGGQRRGAVVTGLGPYDGSLTRSDLIDAVRAGTLRYLLHAADVIGRDQPVPPLAVLLLGYNSSANLSIEASVEALVRGVLEGNQRFREATQSEQGVVQLDIVELYRDTAITAAYALRENGLPKRLEEVADRCGIELEIDSELVQGEGVRERLFIGGGDGYWPRFVITGIAPDDDSQVDGARTNRRVADRLRFLYLGQRARAEAVVQQRQPGFLEELVRRQLHVRVWQPDFGRTLFQLTVPHEFKDVLRQAQRTVLVVDETTANLPWELLLGDESAQAGEVPRPLSQRMALVRQFQTREFRRHLRQSVGRHALVIGNPSTGGYVDAFPSAQRDRPTLPPPPLPAAAEEADAAADLMQSHGYEVERAIGDDHGATDVMVRLYRRPWRIVHIAAHGVFDVMHRDGHARSGVVLSDGFLITAAEIKAMEAVPELVFLNCCHLGLIDGQPELHLRDPNKLAASVARELIEIGVRCVVVAGWAITDTLAQRFGDVFYRALLSGRASFGEAVFEARQELWAANSDDITWGAFQAYGDPDWRAERGESFSSRRGEDPYASPDEVLDALARLRVEFSRRTDELTGPEHLDQVKQVEHIFERRCRPVWRSAAELQSALGETWYELGEFERARTAYLAALQASGRRSTVPVRSIEKLANAEARMGLAQERPGLVDLALLRLRMLDNVVAPHLDAGPGATGPTVERGSLIGSAWRIKAIVCAAQMARSGPGGPGFDTAREAFMVAVREAATAYGAVAGVPGQPSFDPYPALNSLMLKAVMGFADAAERGSAADEARACGEAAKQRITLRFDVWDHVMVVESDFTERVVDGRLGAADLEGMQHAETVRDKYRHMLDTAPLKAVELDSVLGQFSKSASLWRGLALADPDRAAEATRMAMVLQWLDSAIRRDPVQRDEPAVSAQPISTGSVEPTSAAPTEPAPTLKSPGAAKPRRRRRAN